MSGVKKHTNWSRRVALLLPYSWLLALFFLPFLITLKISFSEPLIAMPPYGPTWDTWDNFKRFIDQLSFSNYEFVLSDSLYINAYLSSVRIALISTFMTLLIGYPIAYAIVRAKEKWRLILLTFVILPFWTSFLIRVYAWIGILKTEGLLNLFLETIVTGLGFEFSPLKIYNTELAVFIGITYTYLPFMILPLYAALDKLDMTLIEAASDLGCSPTKAFWRITFPLSMPGVLAGCFLVFIPAVGEFVIPSLLGGANTLMIGKVLWAEFFQNRDWPIASAVAVMLLLVLVVPIVLFQRLADKNPKEAKQ